MYRQTNVKRSEITLSPFNSYLTYSKGLQEKSGYDQKIFISKTSCENDDTTDLRQSEVQMFLWIVFKFPYIPIALYIVKSFSLFIVK